MSTEANRELVSNDIRNCQRVKVVVVVMMEGQEAEGEQEAKEEHAKGRINDPTAGEVVGFMHEAGLRARPVSRGRPSPDHLTITQELRREI
jgi:hypothetical protein